MSRILSFIFVLFFIVKQGRAQSDSLDIMIGQMIMIGISDYDDPGEKYALLEAIETGQVGGAIIYGKNLSEENTSVELTSLVMDLQGSAEIPLFISIDEEGGRVNRLKPKYGYPKTKSAAELAEIDDTDSTYFYARRTAELLAQLGINVNYAPVVDVNVNPENPIIGSLGRSYGEDYMEVIEHASAFIRAHNDVGIATTLKHYPGHGSSADDTHLGIADVSDSWKIEELYPYKALIDSGVVTGIMTAHIVNKTLEEKMLPATLSKEVITESLRTFLGYDGVVFSDDMHMGAISTHYGFEEAITLAVNAGVDVLLFSNNVFDYQFTSAAELHSIVKRKVEEGIIDRQSIEDSYRRIMDLKATLGLFEKGYAKALKKRLKRLN